jgi:hypothetical protein
MSIDHVLPEIFRRSDLLLAAWVVHAATALVVVALVVAAPAVRDDRRARSVLAGVFVFLAFANLEGMMWILMQWQTLADALVQLHVWQTSPGTNVLVKVTTPPHPLWVVPFHLVLDVAVVTLTLGLGQRRVPGPNT